MKRQHRFRAAIAVLMGAILVGTVVSPASATVYARAGYFLENFSSTRLDSDFSIVGEDPGAWSLSSSRGNLTLTTKDANFYEGDNRPVNVFLRDAPSRDYDLTTRLRFDPQQDYEQAGILLWAGPDDYAQLTYSHQGGLAFLGGVESSGRYSTELLENTVGDDVFLRVSKHGDELSFAYSTNGLRWTRVGQSVTSSTAYPQVGLFSSSSGSARAVPARFDFLWATPYLRFPEKPQPALPGDSSAPLVEAGEEVVPYQNPVQEWTSGDPATADPTVARGPDGWFYMVGSESEYSYSPYHALPIFRSRDLVEWTYLTDVFPSVDSYPAWVEDTQGDRIDFWAPDIVFQDGKVFVYYGATQKSDPAAPTNDKAIGVAVAESVEGPFIDKGVPLVTGTTFRAIDQQVFTDTDGKRYLYWGSAFYPLLVQRLSADGMDVVGKVTQALPSHQGSAYIFDTDTQPVRANYENLIEGPWVVKKGAWYYMFYSGPNCCGPGANYTVAVARSTSPLGPFDKLDSNPILAGDERVLAPGHNAVISDDAGQDWMVYHGMDAQQNAIGDASRRNLYIDKIEWRDGWPIVDGPTTDRQEDGPVIAGGSGDLAPLPSPVGDLAASDRTDDSVSISWFPAADGIPIDGYTVYRNGVELAEVGPDATSATIGGLDVCTRYAISVRPIAQDGRRGDAGGRIEETTAGCPEGSVRDRSIDRTTQGDWIGTFGGEGYLLANDGSSAAEGVTITPPAGPFTWTDQTAERRALQKATGDGRIAATWFGTTVPFGISTTDGSEHRVTLYALDWDTPGLRRQSFTVTNQQGEVLDVVSAAEFAAFDGGVSVSWVVTGDVTITAQVEAGANAVVAGVFVDAAP